MAINFIFISKRVFPFQIGVYEYMVCNYYRQGNRYNLYRFKLVIYVHSEECSGFYYDVCFFRT